MKKMHIPTLGNKQQQQHHQQQPHIAETTDNDKSEISPMG